VPDAAALPQVLSVLQAVRAAGESEQMHDGTGEGMGSMKSQFKKADASGAYYALIFGADELARGEVTVKALRDGAGAQTSHPLGQVTDWAPRLQSRT
jgi:histidyl-tRNA synthetase